MSNEQLTTRRMKAIPIMLATPTYEQGRKSARISKATFHERRKNESFAAESNRQRSVSRQQKWHRLRDWVRGEV